MKTQKANGKKANGNLNTVLMVRLVPFLQSHLQFVFRISLAFVSISDKIKLPTGRVLRLRVENATKAHPDLIDLGLNF